MTGTRTPLVVSTNEPTAGRSGVPLRRTRSDRIAFGNTGLPVGRSLGEGFAGWLEMSQTMEFMDAGAMLQHATVARELTSAEIDGSRATFPGEAYMAGAREFRCLVPVTPEHDGVADNLAAWEALERWDKPFLTLWCPGDAVLGHLDQEFIDRVPGAPGGAHPQWSGRIVPARPTR